MLLLLLHWLVDRAALSPFSLTILYPLCFVAVRSVIVLLARQSQSYWRSLQSQLVASRWYARVDSILLQNRVFVALSQVTRPAEAFYSCITEEFVSHDDVGEFMSALKTRVGPAWSVACTHRRTECASDWLNASTRLSVMCLLLLRQG